MFVSPSSNTGYQIQRSLRFRSTAGSYLTKTFGAAGNRKTWTWSGWLKLGRPTNFPLIQEYASGADQGQLGINGSSVIRFYSLSSSSFQADITWLPQLRDPTAWYHIVLAFDSTQAVNTDRVKLFLNGIQQTVSTATWPSLNVDARIQTNNAHYICQNGAGAGYGDGLLAEVNFIDGQALGPEHFGRQDAIHGGWIAKKYIGAYGTNGFYFDFRDPSSAANLCLDRSGNGNNWTPFNIYTAAMPAQLYDSWLDVPLGAGGLERGNYASLNPIDSLNMTTVSFDANGSAVLGLGPSSVTRATMSVSSGKWYWEITPYSMTSDALMIGIADAFAGLSAVNYTQANGWYYYGNGQKWNSNVGAAYGAAYVNTNVIGVALDCDAGTLAFFKNGVSQGTAFTGLTGKTLTPALNNGTAGGDQGFHANFGQRPFAYTPPTDFKAMHTGNLPTPLIPKSNQFFDVTLYTGNNASQSIVNSGSMQPDIVWLKARNFSYNNALYDSSRGVQAWLSSNTTNQESYLGAADLTAFNANGFSLTNTVNYRNNESTITYVGWQWKKGVVPGLDMVLYTGNAANRTIAHGLGVAPKFMIFKDRTGGSNNWPVYHENAGSTFISYLNLTNAKATQAAFLNSTAPTSGVFSLGVDGAANTSGNNYIAYLWSEVPGFSRIGYYTGNGSADGPYVHCGFRPKLIMVKDMGGVSSWWVYDTSRDTFNPMSNLLRWDLANVEATQGFPLIMSNGFKIINTGLNTNGNTHIFIAFAEAPFKYANAR